MRKHLYLTAVTALAAMPAIATAQMPASGPSTQVGIYVGGGIGVASADPNENDFGAQAIVNALNASGLGPASATWDKSAHEAGGKGFIGWRFHRYVAVEGGYYYLGKFKNDYTGTVLGGTPYSAGADSKVDGWNLSALGIVPLTETFAAFGRVGAFNSKVDTDFTVQGVKVLSASKRETTFSWGAGVQWDIGQRWAIRGEYENFGEAGNVDSGRMKMDMWSASALYKF
jgi:opacity protein-like surface antigen